MLLGSVLCFFGVGLAAARGSLSIIRRLQGIFSGHFSMLNLEFRHSNKKHLLGAGHARLCCALMMAGFMSVSCGMKGDLYLPDDKPAKESSAGGSNSEARGTPGRSQ